ncbi:hypothetical protein GXP70_18865 [Paenibacillus lycopersici]|uniref:Paeninodin family lasso peptide n=1 Tax=Paenibacillus lycopersici TaxID=2704462 RepID=A0A6C0FXJ7_9BACL|nr:hypothetical protein [Paenibacillus lycopersici]QHT61836.1 hypothetical protein GXP70_18865 [Paenibacillus lycopersici]
MKEMDQSSYHQQGKKAWEAPRLDVLDIRNTEHGGLDWQFIWDGDFWKREVLSPS